MIQVESSHKCVHIQSVDCSHGGATAIYNVHTPFFYFFVPWWLLLNANSSCTYLVAPGFTAATASQNCNKADVC